jgi:FMN phosphatase YigB (HAD superfamily)
VCLPYSIDNLHQVAAELGIRRCWFHRDHYDIPKRRVDEVLQLCEVVGSRTILEIIRRQG